VPCSKIVLTVLLEVHIASISALARAVRFFARRNCFSMLPSLYLLSVRDLRFDCLAPRPSLYLLSIHDLRFDCLAPRASLRLFLIRDLRSATFASLASSCRELRRSKIRPSSRPGPGRWAAPKPRTRACPRHLPRRRLRRSGSSQ
jgi:hypothetical protein